MSVSSTAFRSPRKRLVANALMLAPIVALLVLFFLWPAAQFLFRAVQANDGGFDLTQFRRLFANPVYLAVMWQTVTISFSVTIITLVVSYPVAYVLARTDKTNRYYWFLFVLLPFWSSFLVRTFAVIVVMGRNGPLNEFAQSAGLSHQPLKLLYTHGAVLFGMTSVLTPFAILTMVGVMERIEPRLMAASQSMGAHPIQAFFTVFLPLSMPGVTAASLLVFVTSLGFFITPALLGSERETMIAQPIIQQVIDLANWRFAAVLCTVLFVTTVVILFLYHRWAGLTSLVGRQDEKAPRRLNGASGLFQRACNLTGDVLAGLARAVPGRSRGRVDVGGGVRSAAFFVLLVLNVPVLFLIPVSFSTSAFVEWPPSGFGFGWYEQYFSSPLWIDATVRSFVVALSTAVGCIVVGVPAALAFIRLSGHSAALLFALIVSPMILPKIIIAVGLFYLYAKIGLVGTNTGLVLGHVVVSVPFFFISTLAVLRTYDWRVDQASASLGASPLRTVRHVTLPLLSTGLISASLFAFIISMDELNISLFTTGGISSTLPKMMWENAAVGFTPLLAAVSTLFLILLTGLAMTSILIGGGARR